jgi:tellurite resistance protein/uncharacterized protein (DUF697 family)
MFNVLETPEVPMTHQDAETVVAIAAMAAMADGHQDASELAAITDAATRLGLTGAVAAIAHAASGQLTTAQLATQLSDDEARHAAYDVAVAVCSAGGTPNPMEVDFLRALATSLGVDATPANAAASAVTTSSLTTSTAGEIPAGSSTVGAATPDPLDTHILDQAMLTAALELLPDRLANLGILPLQMRLVHHIGQQYGQQTDVNQIKDLAATFGLGAAAQVMESVVRKAFGGIAGGLLGGLFGGAAGVAAGGAVTFASTYALGHAAQQYYAQGRSLSTADMKALFARFQGDANTMYPRVQERIATLAQGTNLSSIMRSVTG